MSTVNLTASTFDETVRDNDIVLVDFWASWCGPCRRFGPVFEKTSEQHPGIVFGKVDTEAEHALAARAGITSIPTLMAFREQVLVYAQAGALSGPALKQRIAMIEGLDMDDLRARSAAQQSVS